MASRADEAQNFASRVDETLGFGMRCQQEVFSGSGRFEAEPLNRTAMGMARSVGGVVGATFGIGAIVEESFRVSWAALKV